MNYFSGILMSGIANWSIRGIFVTLFGMCRFTLINTISMKHLVCHNATKNSYTFGWEIPMAMFCFLAEARVEIDTLKP